MKPTCVGLLSAVAVFVALMIQYSQGSADRANLADTWKSSCHLRSRYDKRNSLKPLFIRLYTSSPLCVPEPVNHDITNAVISVHGFGRRAVRTFLEAMRSLEDWNMTRHVLAVVPYFGKEPVKESDWAPKAARLHERRGKQEAISAFWTGSRHDWLTGGNSNPKPGTYSTTSFDVLDELLELLLRKGAYPGLFYTPYPNLESVTFFGFSAGAQLVQQHAFFSRLTSPNARWLISDPSSYLYVTPHRPAAECRSLRNTGVNHTCEAFEIPASQSIRDSTASYDNLKYGIADLDDAGNNMYIKSRIKEKDFRSRATAIYLTRDLRFISGSDDACNCVTAGYINDASCYLHGHKCFDSYPDAHRNLLDISTPAMLQGSNRLQRSLNYVSYIRLLKREYSDAGLISPSDTMHGVFDGGHDGKIAIRADFVIGGVMEASVLEKFPNPPHAPKGLNPPDAPRVLLAVAGAAALVVCLIAVQMARRRRHPLDTGGYLSMDA